MRAVGDRTRRWVRRLRLPRPPRGWSTLRVLVSAVVLVALAGGLVGGLIRVQADIGPGSFLPAGDPTLSALQDSARSFGGDPVVVLAESKRPNAFLEPEQLRRLIGLEGTLSRLPDVAVVYGPGTVVNQLATTSQNLLAGVFGRRDAVRAAAEKRARDAGATKSAVAAAGDKAVAEFDRRYGALLVRGLPAGLPTVGNPRFVKAVVFDTNGEPRQAWRFVVPAPDAVAILVRPREGADQAAVERLVGSVRSAVQESGLQTRRVVVTGTPALASDLGAQLVREVPLLGGIAIGLIGGAYLLVPWVPSRWRRLVPPAAAALATAVVLATFGWLGTPLSLGVIAFLPILAGIGSDFPAYLVRGAQRRTVLVAALAAAAGFASLGISPLPFVADLGLALAAGVLIAVLLALLFVRWGGTPHAEDPPPAAPAPPVRRRRLLVTCAVVLAACGWFVLPKLGVESNPDRLAEGMPSVSEARHAEDVLGSSGEVQVLLDGNDMLTPQALRWMRKAEDAIVAAHGRDLRPVVTMPDLLAFLGERPTPQQIHAAVRLLPPYLTGAVLRHDGRAAVLSFGMKLDDLDRQQRLFADLRTTLPPPPAGYTVRVTGLPVAVAQGYELVSADRYLSNGLGIAAAGAVLCLGLRRRLDGVRAIAAASLATGWGLAGMWVFGVALTPLTAALGSLTVATACEFTVLLTAGAAVSRGMRRTVSVAALAACLGYLTLALSGLTIISRFGLLLAATVCLSLLAAQLVVRVSMPPDRGAATSKSACAEPRRAVTV